MGANSAKAMRGQGMDDVIFAGAAGRPPRSHAEVSLTIDNAQRRAPQPFTDSPILEVSRRIDRGQGSTYRINGKEARAKDVQLLFADASTGARSPSMVGQGRIGELINAKPQARRQLLEEAAGISGLHSRRHEAELRLRAAEANLERLEDVTAQLESQIESLKRQARQANRFKMLSADIRSREATLLHIRWVEAKDAEGEAESALNQATNIVAEKAQAQMEAAKEQAKADAAAQKALEKEAARQAAQRQKEAERLEREAVKEAQRRQREAEKAAERRQREVEKTIGSVLIAQDTDLPDGGRLTLSRADYVTSGGVRLEKRGVTPDILTPRTLSQRRAGEAADQPLRQPPAHRRQPAAAQLATTRARCTRCGKVATHSAARIPPKEPPMTVWKRAMPRASATRASARA